MGQRDGAGWSARWAERNGWGVAAGEGGAESKAGEAGGVRLVGRGSKKGQGGEEKRGERDGAVQQDGAEQSSRGAGRSGGGGAEWRGRGRTKCGRPRVRDLYCTLRGGYRRARAWLLSAGSSRFEAADGGVPRSCPGSRVAIPSRLAVPVLP